mmetsp:Transcript_38125/g.104981  ORF Transcript_38125/g.104981 Transcript_38125/m.104981 type:complete len:226 (-) Transcript_38125:2174-2851(-)
MRESSQDRPLLMAPVAMVRVRTVCPPPHVTSQSPQLLHCPSLQSMVAFSPFVMQELVVLRSPEQPVPPKVGLTRILRSLYLWPVSALHVDQLPHSDSLQLWLEQLAGQTFTSASLPLHGVPQALFSFVILRARLQTPSQLGGAQSDHAETKQFTGLQPTQGLLVVQRAASVRLPTQSEAFDAPDTGTTPAGGSLSVSSNFRVLDFVALPHVLLQAPNAVQSSQTQ